MIRSLSLSLFLFAKEVFTPAVFSGGDRPRDGAVDSSAALIRIELRRRFLSH